MKHDSTTYLRQRLTIKSVPQTTKKFSKFEKTWCGFFVVVDSVQKNALMKKPPGKKPPRKLPPGNMPHR